MEDRLDKLEKKFDRFIERTIETSEADAGRADGLLRQIRQLQEADADRKSDIEFLVTNNDEEFVMLKERVNHLESQQENRKYLTEYTQNTDNSVARWFV